MLNKKSIVCLLSLLVLVIGFAVAKKLASDVTLNENGLTSLMESIENSNNTKAKFLIALGSNLKIKSSNEETPLFLAVFNKNEEIVKYILKKDKSTVNIPNDRDRQPLEVALESGFTSIAFKLIDAGADVNCNSSGIPSLQFAIYKEYYDIAKVLIEKGADVNSKSNLGKTSLYYAAEKNKLDIVKLLLEKGADTNIKDSMGHTVLVFVVDKDNLDMAKLLIEKGADVNNVGNSPMATPLFHANSQAMIDLLLSKGADPNFQSGGYTAKKFAEQTIRINNYHNNYTPTLNPKIGMTASEVEKSTWGKPEKINRTTTKYGTSEQWVYSNNRYIYLDEGKVTAIQDHK